METNTLEQTDWKAILRTQCAVLGQRTVAQKLNVSSAIVRQVLHGTYPSKKTKLESLVLLHFSDDLDHFKEGDNWVDILREACQIYTRRQIAAYLGVSHTLVSAILQGKYNHKSMVQYKVLSKIGKTLEDVNRLKLGQKRGRISLFQKLVAEITDYILCNSLATKSGIQQALESEFTLHRITLTLNSLVSQKMLVKSVQIGERKKITSYKLACGCLTPGLDESCRSCPLGQIIINLDKRCEVDYDDDND